MTCYCLQILDRKRCRSLLSWLLHAKNKDYRIHKYQIADLRVPSSYERGGTLISTSSDLLFLLLLRLDRCEAIVIQAFDIKYGVAEPFMFLLNICSSERRA